VARYDAACVVGQDRRGPAPSPDRRGDLRHLLRRMRPRVLRIQHERRDLPIIRPGAAAAVRSGSRMAKRGRCCIRKSIRGRLIPLWPQEHIGPKPAEALEPPDSGTEQRCVAHQSLPTKVPGRDCSSASKLVRPSGCGGAVMSVALAGYDAAGPRSGAQVGRCR